MKGKILVTGGTGYIGSHTILQILRNTEFEPLSVDNFSRSHAAALDRIEQISGKRVKNYEVDLTDISKTEQIFEENKDIVGVIHFAAYKSVGESVEQPIMYYENNFGSLLNILKCCVKFNIENFIFSSSCSVYGNVEKLPVTEETPVQDTESPYAHTKKVGEEIIKNFAIKYTNINTIPLRYFNPVGADLTGLNGEDTPDKPNNLVPVITRTAAGIQESMVVFGGDYSTRDGSCIRDYIHVLDIADAHILALQYLLEGKNESNYEIFNLGTGNGVSVLEAIEAFEKVSDQKLNYKVLDRRPGDVEAIYSDSTKAKDILGWIPKYGIQEMMDSAWKWQQNLGR